MLGSLLAKGETPRISPNRQHNLCGKVEGSFSSNERKFEDDSWRVSSSYCWTAEKP